VGAGKELRIYDPNLNLAEMMGANEQIISRTMPHLARLLTPDAASAVAGADLIIIAQKCAGLEELRACLTTGQSVIDVNGWSELSRLGVNYTGSCW
jgi:GDP-mannose 6-dehydrogenase